MCKAAILAGFAVITGDDNRTILPVNGFTFSGDGNDLNVMFGGFFIKIFFFCSVEASTGFIVTAGIGIGLGDELLGAPAGLGVMEMFGWINCTGDPIVMTLPSPGCTTLLPP